MINATYVVDFDGTVLLRSGDLNKSGFGNLENSALISAVNKLAADILNIAQRKGLYICICSGNIIENILPKVEAQGFFPDAISCKVGTELWCRQSDNSYILDAAHTAAMGENFNNSKIQEIVGAFFQSYGIVTFPHASKMNGPGKESCHVPLRDEQDLPNVHPLEKELEAAGFSVKIDKSLITELSEIDDFRKRGFNPKKVYNFDIVKLLAGKEQIAIRIFNNRRAYYNIVGGDGGNDIPLLKSEPTKAIIVGNSAEDLRYAAETISYSCFSQLPSGLAIAENILRDAHLMWDELPEEVNSLPEPFRKALYKAAHGLKFMLPGMVY